MINHQDTTIFNGIVGTTTSLGATAFSLLPQVETWLRISSLVIGLVIAILTLDKILKERKKNK
jgi:energy-converting hydrogenase Eha subunit B